MAIEVKIPKEITEYKEKIIFGLSIRQLVCFSIAIVLSISAYLLCTKIIGLSTEIAGYIVIFLSMPLLAMGFVRPNGMNFEKYAVLMLRYKFGHKVRKYKTELLIDDIAIKENGGKTNEPKKPAKYGWIFTKSEKPQKRSRADRQEERFDKQLRECEIFEVTKEGRKAKGKITKRKIKEARSEYRCAKRRA